ncbi:MAG TPA: hypothetical protein VKA88_08850 [Solirubrobacterales bacterium]|nr:hypothetical protein [Solirubrobacterales bacterium]
MPGIHVPLLRLANALLIGQDANLRARLAFSGPDLTLSAGRVVLLPHPMIGMLRELAVGKGLIAVRSQLISVRGTLLPDGQLDIQVGNGLVTVGSRLIGIRSILVRGCPSLVVAKGGKPPQLRIALISVP